MAQGPSVMKGVCTHFNDRGGFGFINCDDGSGKVLVHISDIKAQGFKKLNVGERVEFEVIVQDDGRRKAIKINVPQGQGGGGDDHDGGHGGGCGVYGGGGRYGGGGGGGGSNKAQVKIIALYYNCSNVIET
tara:strand:- start:159 stop:551 length:393 start_codon:yes stop_codon:yes gene_type:complete